MPETREMTETLSMAERASRFHTHQDACEFFGVPRYSPRPDYLPYAVQATVIEVYVNGARKVVWGGGMRCGQCNYGVDVKPGEPGVIGPHGQTTDADRLRCPKCGYDGSAAPRLRPANE
ncbi:MAG: hypothetical protein ACTHNC_14070 [Humibacter sp.]